MAKSAVCIIPARGGSKRIPRKNIRPFAGKPLIAHSIATALESNCFDRVIVSTDDGEIAGIATEHGAEVPFCRDAALADDHATTAQVLQDALRQIGEREFPLACCLYPTAPLLRPGDLVASMEQFRKSDAQSMLCTTEFDYSPFRALVLRESGFVEFQFPENALTRSQDLPKVVHDAGAFYWVRVPEFLADKNIVTDNTIAFPLPRTKCVDIDTEEDLHLAEQLYTFHERRE